MNFISTSCHSERSEAESRNLLLLFLMARIIIIRDVSTSLDMTEPIDAGSVSTFLYETALTRLYHGFAPIAQIGMLFACADSWTVTPATGAFLVCCFGDRRARFVCLANRQIAQNEKFLQLFLADFCRDIRV